MGAGAADRGRGVPFFPPTPVGRPRPILPPVIREGGIGRVSARDFLAFEFFKGSKKQIFVENLYDDTKLQICYDTV